jgi:exopolyphosphatase/guanosine-5'-triphosphate,3'-diphosphate pyrophosphatase
MTEIEAKFIIPDKETFDALLNLSKLDTFILKPVATKLVTDRYLDTADGRFMKAGYALRIRRSGKKRIATLKSLTPATDAIHRREEFETEITSDSPQFWPTSEVKALTLDIAAGTELVLLFVINQKRYKFETLLAGKPVIEFSLDEVSLTEDGTPDYRELEAELIEAGTEEDLHQFVQALGEQWPLQAEAKSKFERAFAHKQQNKTAESG